MNFNKQSKKFKIKYNGLTLEFEFYTKNFILKKLRELEDLKFISSVRCVEILENRNPFSELKKEYLDEQGKEKYHFFAYVKFFEYKGEEYGIVGGKTNYPNPDITFDYWEEKDNRIARTFLYESKLKWNREIVVLNHAPVPAKETDEKQAIFLECFLQRKFNLLNS